MSILYIHLNTYVCIYVYLYTYFYIYIYILTYTYLCLTTYVLWIYKIITVVMSIGWKLHRFFFWHDITVWKMHVNVVYNSMELWCSKVFLALFWWVVHTVFILRQSFAKSVCLLSWMTARITVHVCYTSRNPMAIRCSLCCEFPGSNISKMLVEKPDY